MNLLFLLLLATFSSVIGAAVLPTSVPEKVTSSNDAAQQIVADNPSQPNSQDAAGDKKVTKRSYGWNPWGYIGYSWPWYGWYPGWYPSWPFYGHGYGGYYGGYRSFGHGYGGWYKGW